MNETNKLVDWLLGMGEFPFFKNLLEVEMPRMSERLFTQYESEDESLREEAETEAKIEND